MTLIEYLALLRLQANRGGKEEGNPYARIPEEAIWHHVLLHLMNRMKKLESNSSMELQKMIAGNEQNSGMYVFT